MFGYGCAAPRLSGLVGEFCVTVTMTLSGIAGTGGAATCSDAAAADMFVLSLECGTAQRLPGTHNGADVVPAGAAAKNKGVEALADHTNSRSSNHGYQGSPNHPGRRWGTWGVRSCRTSTVDDSRKLNLSIEVEVRNSATGGWNGVYDDKQLPAINFNAPDDTMFTTIEMHHRTASGGSESPDNLDSDNLDFIAPPTAATATGQERRGPTRIMMPWKTSVRRMA